MLALEVVLAGADGTPTMVFDEVDAGVGGRAAVEIGRRLARLAAYPPGVVVTHLPQVAAFADRHLVVDKADRGSGTTQRRARGATIPTGLASSRGCWRAATDTETGRAHAEELLAAARATGRRPGGHEGGQRRSRPARRGTAPVPA